MPRFFGLTMSGGAFALRIASAVAFSAIAFLVLTYIPANLTTLASGILPASGGVLGRQVLSSLIDPSKPSLGLFVVLLVFAGVLLRGTAIYGLILILVGVEFALYVYLFFEGGVMHLTAHGSVLGASSAGVALTVNATTLMVVLMIPALLTTLKGLLLLRSS